MRIAFASMNSPTLAAGHASRPTHRDLEALLERFAEQRTVPETGFSQPLLNVHFHRWGQPWWGTGRPAIRQPGHAPCFVAVQIIVDALWIALKMLDQAWHAHSCGVESDDARPQSDFRLDAITPFQCP